MERINTDIYGKINNALPVEYSWQNSLDGREQALLSFAQKSISDTIKSIYAKHSYAKNRINLKAFVNEQ